MAQELVNEFQIFKCSQNINQTLGDIEKKSKELSLLYKKLKDDIKQKSKKLEVSFYYDHNIKIKNYNAFLKDQKEINFSAFILLDIKEFFYFIELYGITVGNEILKFFGHFLIYKLSSDKYHIYHFNNDQFIIAIKSKTTNYKSLEISAKKILKFVKEFEYCSVLYKEKFNFEARLGICQNTKDPIQKALIALSYAKNANKDFMIHSIEMTNSSIYKDVLFWKKQLQSAIEEDRIIPVFQPIVNKNEQIEKYEILMRLVKYENGKKNLISPIFFLDISKKTKLYDKLSMIMMEKGFEVISKCDAQFSFNLSFEDIINKKIIKHLKNLIQKYKIGNRLILEIVESSDVKNYEAVRNFIKEFKKFGVEIAIDDFGAGYSNYMHILELEPDYIKIDGSLIKNIDQNKKSYEFVKSISNLAKALNIKTVAEFVHSKEIFEVCKSLKIDNYQGFYFSPPLEKEKLQIFKLENV